MDCLREDYIDALGYLVLFEPWVNIERFNDGLLKVRISAA